MTTLVDLRRWRIEADPVRLAPPDALCAQPLVASPEGVEIILFPKIGRGLLQRSRRSLKRRFASRMQADAG